MPANTQSYNNTGLTAETEYCYRVRATNDFGDSAYVGPVCDTTGASTPTTGWIAYNDLNNALSTNAANVTEYTYEATDAVLKNYLSGADLSVTMTGSTLPIIMTHTIMVAMLPTPLQMPTRYSTV